MVTFKENDCAAMKWSASIAMATIPQIPHSQKSLKFLAWISTAQDKIPTPP